MEILTKFLNYVLAIVLVYIGQTLFKIVVSLKTGEFSWKSLWQGLLEHLVYFVGIICVFLSGIVLPNITVAEINGVNYTLTDLLCMVALVLYIKQSVDAVRNIAAKYNVSEEIGEIKEVYPAQDKVLGSDLVESEDTSIKEETKGE